MKLLKSVALLMLTVSLSAQSVIQYENKEIDIEYIYNTYLDSNFVDSLFKYHLGGSEGRIAMNKEAVRTIGAETLQGFNFGVYADTSLYKAYSLLTGVNVEKQTEFKYKLCWQRKKMYWDEFKNDTIIGWSKDNGLNCGIAVGQHINGDIFIQKKGGEIKALQKESIKIASEKEIKEYY